MTAEEFATAWPILKKQVKSLNVPWLDQMASAERDPFKVLISCILSLRTKDEVTGAASERLFRAADNARKLSMIPAKEIEKLIFPVGFFRVKALRIREMSGEILKKYGGRVPDTIEGLLELKGVGRKTANLVVTLGYNKPGICVDVHVHRIANRWGLVKTKTPHETEFALRTSIPVRYWRELNGNLVAFGQGICRPVSPFCSVCRIRPLCARIGVKKSR